MSYQDSSAVILEPNILATLFQHVGAETTDYDASISLVCKVWRRVYLVQFCWHKLFVVYFHAEVPFSLIPRILVANLKYITMSVPYEIITDRPELGALAFDHFSAENLFLIKYINFLLSDERQEHTMLWRNFVTVKMHIHTAVAKVVCCININKLKQFSNKNLLSSDSFVWKYLDTFSDHNNDALSSIACHTEIKIAPMAQPKGFIPYFALAEHQRKALAWLYNVEHSDRHMTSYQDLVCWHTRQGIVYLDKHHKMVVSGSLLSSYPKTTYYAKGGFLVAPRNRGRKSVFLGLILATLDEPIDENYKNQTDLQYSNATLIYTSEQAEWKQEIRNTVLKVIEDESPTTTKADIVIVSNNNIQLFKPPTTNKNSLQQFLWKRIIVHNPTAFNQNQMRNIQSLKALNWWGVSQSLNTRFDHGREATIAAMQLLGFPPHSAFEFITQYTWKVPRRSTDVYNYAPFVAENIEVSEHPAERHYPHLRVQEISLDQARSAALKQILNIVAKKIPKAERFNQICGDLHAYQVLRKFPNIYHGPPLKLSKLFPHIADSLVIHRMRSYSMTQEIHSNISMSLLVSEPRKKSVLPIEPERETTLAKTKELFTSLMVKDKGEYTKENIKAFLLNCFGTKIATLMFILEKIWENDPVARVIVSSVAAENLRDVLDQMGIAAGLITIDIAGPKLPCQIRGTKNDKIPRVFILDANDRAISPTASFAVSHIIYLDSVLRKESETRILAGARCQGDKKVVHVVRVYFKDSHEHYELHKRGIVDTQPEKEEVPSIDDLSAIARDSALGKMLVASGALAKFAQLRYLVVP